MKLTWLTQSGYLLEEDGFRLVIDPYLSDAATAKGATRIVPAPMNAQDLAPDALLCTHCHVDHWDPVGAPEILSTHPTASLIAPASVRPLALAEGVAEKRIVPLDVGMEIQAGPFAITALPTIHSDPHGIGCLIRCGATSIYHSGDTEYSTTLAKELRSRIAEVTPQVSVALLCINGRLGNQTWQEAALIAELLQPSLVIPHHYDLFLENQQAPAPFLERCGQLGLSARALVAGVPEEI
jgi:L-ascorbate metabolism protein UlaG (beta-lactamase superfamily)